MADLAAETVAEHLRDRATRSATLAALEGHATPIPTAVSLAAAPALLGLMTMDAAEVERDAYDRAGLLLGRLHAEALPDSRPCTGRRSATEDTSGCGTRTVCST